MQKIDVQIGVSARALMGFAFDDARGAGLMSLAIGFVGRTFGSDAQASKQLVERLLDPARMAEHAADDMHWLAQEVGRISEVDPEFAVSIYEAIFRHFIDEGQPTRLGNSQIMPLTSDSRQDFKMAQWSLKEAYPAFFERHPEAAAWAAIGVARAYRDTLHALRDPDDRQSVQVGNFEAGLTTDFSYIWAAQHRSEYSDDAREIVDGFVDGLLGLEESKALAIVRIVISSSDLAWLWARMFMVGAQRGGAIAEELWPWAAQMPFLRSPDTVKDAIDLVAAGYVERSEAERIAFENQVMAATFPQSDIPDKRALQFKRRVFGAIGLSRLVTPAARNIVEEAAADRQLERNDRLYGGAEAEWVEAAEFHHLQSAGVDTRAVPNVPVLDAIRRVEARGGSAQSAASRIDVVALLVAQLVGSPPDVHELVRKYGWDTAARELESATHEFPAVKGLTPEQKTALLALIEAFPSGQDRATTPSEFARESLAGLLLNLARLDKDIATRFRDAISAFAHDTADIVRGAVAARLAYLWNTNRDLGWELATEFARTDANTHVLINVGGFANRVMHFELDRACTLILDLVERVDGFEEPARSEVLDELGRLIFRLWTRYDQHAARALLDKWLSMRDAYKGALGRGAFSIREGLTLAYETDDFELVAASVRCQKLAYEIIDATAKGLEQYIAAEPGARTAEMDQSASNDAHLLDTMGSQFLFAIGPSEIREGKQAKTLVPLESRRAFLGDNTATLMRVGDVGTPKTIYYLLQLLEFLVPANPEAVFDIVAHAMLSGGKVHGFQMESLGASRFVAIVGGMVADHRAIFEDPARRLKLVEILELFVEMGWPDARRLLYRLPEALR